MRRGGGWRAARPCRRGRPAGPGTRSRAVAGGAALAPLRAAGGPVAGRQGGLASRPGPQASTLDSARPVKSARPSPGKDHPRTRHPDGGTVARAAVPSPASSAPPGMGVPACGQRPALGEGPVMGGADPARRRVFRSHAEIRFPGAFFTRSPETGSPRTDMRPVQEPDVPAVLLSCTCDGLRVYLGRSVAGPWPRAAARRAGQPGDGTGRGRAGPLSRARGRFTRRPATRSRYRPPRRVWRRPRSAVAALLRPGAGRRRCR